MTPPKAFSEQRITFEMATHDDVLSGMVPSDLRKLVLERDRAEATVTELRAQVAGQNTAAGDPYCETCGFSRHLSMHSLEQSWRADAAEARCKQQAVSISEAHDHLMNAQPHIDQGVESWADVTEFVDAHVRMAMKALAQHPATDEPESLREASQSEGGRQDG